MFYRARLFASALLFLSFVTSCASLNIGVRNNLIKRLNGRGPVALSSKNPYIAPNLFLSEEMEKSPQIEAFVKHRGAPAAIEVYKELFAPLYLYFYYPENAEMFSLMRLNDEWEVEGPHAISKGVLTLVKQATKGIKGKPKVNFPTIDPPKKKPTRKQTKKKVTKENVDLFDPATSEIAKKQDPMISELQEFETAKLEKIGEKKEPGNEEGEEIVPLTPPKPSPTIAPFTSDGTGKNTATEVSVTKSIDSIIESYGIAPAELTPKGDLVHYVTYPGETLALISLWYTKESENAARLARMNKLQPSTKLELGDVIIVPTYLIKNTNRLNQSALTKMQNLAK